MANILILSNGHGEDISGALIAKELIGLNHHTHALPLVGKGKAYADKNIKIIGSHKEFSTGGIGYTSFSGRVAELLEGQLFYLLNRVFKLLIIAPKYDMLLIVGDVVPVFAAWLTRLPVVTYLVAYSSHYEGNLKLPWPCLECLKSKRFLAVYPRDELTALQLVEKLSTKVEFLGNPFMDPVSVNRDYKDYSDNDKIGFLPGSRMPELERNLLLMLSVIELLTDMKIDVNKVDFDLALVPSLDDFSLERLILSKGWRLLKSKTNRYNKYLVKGNSFVRLKRNSFIEIIQKSDLLVSMAGTASEQAIGIGKPVVQIQGFGPQFTTSFAEAQRRLLGPYIFCADGEPGELVNLLDTARLIKDLLKKKKFDNEFNESCFREAKKRLGLPNGSIRIAESIDSLLNQ